MDRPGYESLKRRMMAANISASLTVKLLLDLAFVLRLLTDELDKHFLCSVSFLAFARASSYVFAVRLHVPGRAVVVFVNLQSLLQLLFQLRVGNGHDGFHAAV